MNLNKYTHHLLTFLPATILIRSYFCSIRIRYQHWHRYRHRYRPKHLGFGL